MPQRHMSGTCKSASLLRVQLKRFAAIELGKNQEGAHVKLVAVPFFRPWFPS